MAEGQWHDVKYLSIIVRSLLNRLRRVLQRSIEWRVFLGDVVQAVHLDSDLVGDIKEYFYRIASHKRCRKYLLTGKSLRHNYEQERERELLRHPFPCSNSFKFSGSLVLVPFELRFPFL